MVFNATFNNISVISWWSILLVEETGVPGENHRPLASYWQTLSHTVVSSTPLPGTGFELTMLAVIGADCISSCKSNYHNGYDHDDLTLVLYVLLLYSQLLQLPQQVFIRFRFWQCLHYVIFWTYWQKKNFKGNTFYFYVA